jgi:ankyrin repeat protein
MLSGEFGNKEMCEYLIINQANINATTLLGDNALTLAQRNSSHDIVMLLVQKGCSLRSSNRNLKPLKA